MFCHDPKSFQGTQGQMQPRLVEQLLGQMAAQAAKLDHSLLGECLLALWIMPKHKSLGGQRLDCGAVQLPYSGLTGNHC